MDDAKQNPDATPDNTDTDNTDKKRQHQTDESHGSVKGPQVTEAQMEERRRDMPAGSAGERRRAGKGAR